MLSILGFICIITSVLFTIYKYYWKQTDQLSADNIIEFEIPPLSLDDNIIPQNSSNPSISLDSNNFVSNLSHQPNYSNSSNYNSPISQRAMQYESEIFKLNQIFGVSEDFEQPKLVMSDIMVGIDSAHFEEFEQSGIEDIINDLKLRSKSPKVKFGSLIIDVEDHIIEDTSKVAEPITPMYAPAVFVNDNADIENVDSKIEVLQNDFLPAITEAHEELLKKWTGFGSNVMYKKIHNASPELRNAKLNGRRHNTKITKGY